MFSNHQSTRILADNFPVISYARLLPRNYSICRATIEDTNDLLTYVGAQCTVPLLFDLALRLVMNVLNPGTDLCRAGFPTRPTGERNYTMPSYFPGWTNVALRGCYYPRRLLVVEGVAADDYICSEHRKSSFMNVVRAGAPTYPNKAM